MTEPIGAFVFGYPQDTLSKIAFSLGSGWMSAANITLRPRNKKWAIEAAAFIPVTMQKINTQISPEALIMILMCRAQQRYLGG